MESRLEQAGRNLLRLAVKTRIVALDEQASEPRLFLDPYNVKTRREERIVIHKRWTELFGLLGEIEQTRPSSLEQALDRFERILPLLVDPGIDKLLGLIVNRCGGDLPSGCGFFLLGSGSSGGAQIRRISGTYIPEEHRPDIDLVMVGDFRDNVLRSRITEDTEDEIGFAGYGLCDVYSLNTVIEIEPNKTEIKRDLINHTMGALAKFIRVFAPSYPESVGIEYRKNLLGALEEISHEDPVLWREIVNFFRDEFKRFYVIKNKYFNSMYTTSELSNLNVFLDLINKAFFDMLLATAT